MKSVLLGLRICHHKEDIDYLVTGTTFRISQEFLILTVAYSSVEESTQRDNVECTTGSQHLSDNKKVFVHPALQTSIHVILWNGAIKKSLQQLYIGYYEDIEPKLDKLSKVKFDYRTLHIAVNRLKPAFLYNIVPRNRPIAAHQDPLYI